MIANLDIDTLAVVLGNLGVTDLCHACGTSHLWNIVISYDRHTQMPFESLRASLSKAKAKLEDQVNSLYQPCHFAYSSVSGTIVRSAARSHPHERHARGSHRGVLPPPSCRRCSFDHAFDIAWIQNKRRTTEQREIAAAAWLAKRQRVGMSQINKELLLLPPPPLYEQRPTPPPSSLLIELD